VEERSIVTGCKLHGRELLWESTQLLQVSGCKGEFDCGRAFNGYRLQVTWERIIVGEYSIVAGFRLQGRVLLLRSARRMLNFAA